MNIVVSLAIHQDINFSYYDNNNHKLDKVVCRCKIHPSILAMKEKVPWFNSTFSFNKADHD